MVCIPAWLLLLWPVCGVECGGWWVVAPHSSARGDVGTGAGPSPGLEMERETHRPGQAGVGWVGSHRYCYVMRHTLQWDGLMAEGL